VNFTHCLRRITRGIQDFDNFVEKENLVSRFKIGHRANVGQISQMKGQYFEDMDTATKLGNRDLVEELTGAGIEGGYVDPTVGTNAKEQALDKIEYNEAWRDMMASPDRASAVDAISGAPITPGQKNALITRYDQEAAHAEAQAKEQLEAAQTATQDDFISRAFSPEDSLTHTEIDNSNLEPNGGGSKAYYHNLVEERDKAVLAGERLPYQRSDPKVLAKVFTRNTDPNLTPMTAPEIADLLGNGLSWEDVKYLTKTIGVRESDVFKNTEAFLKTQFGYEGMLKGFGAKPIGATYYNNALTEILGDLAESPLKGVELMNRMYELAKPHLENYWDVERKSQKDRDEILKLMGVKQSPIHKIIQDSKPSRKKYKRGEGWTK